MSLLPRMCRVTTEAEGFSSQEVARWRRDPGQCPIGGLSRLSDASFGARDAAAAASQG